MGIGMTGSSLYELASNGAVALVAAFVGAYSGAHFAYKNERAAKKQSEREAELLHAQRTLFVLGAQLNALLHYKKEVLNPARYDERPWLTMLPVSTRDYAELQHEINELAFLLGSEDAEVAFDVHIVNAQFHSAIDAIRKRTQYMEQIVQPAVELAVRDGILIHRPDGNIMGETGALEHALGFRLVGTAKNYATDVFSHVDSTVDTLSGVTQKLRSILKTRFPGSKFTVMSVPPDCSSKT